MKRHFILVFLLILQVGIMSHVLAQTSRNELEAVRREEGFLKVITKDKDTVIIRNPVPASEVVGSVGQFRFLYVFPADESGKESLSGFYRIGRTPDRADGWIRKDQVEEWSNDEVARFAPLENRSLEKIYASQNDLVDVIQSGNPPLPFPLSEEFYDSSRTKYSMLLPVLRKNSITINGKPHTFYELAYLHNGGTDLGALFADYRQLDLVFVVDTTRSMQPFLDPVKKIIKIIIEKMIQQPGINDVRVGLVGFRDYPRNYPKVSTNSAEFINTMSYVVNHYSPLTADYLQFNGALETVKTTESSSDDWAEAMYDGLWLAINEMSWQKYAIKNLILIGDSSGHDPEDPKNPNKYSIDKILDNAEQKKIRISPIKIESKVKGIKANDDEALLRTQMKKLAEGRNSETKGVFIEIKDTDSPNEFIGQLTGLIDHDLKKARERGEIALGGIQHELLENSAPLSQKDWTIILRSLSPSLSGQALGKTEVSKGWIAATQNGIEVVRPHLLVTRNQLNQLNNFLIGIRIVVRSPSEENWSRFERLAGETVSTDDVLAGHLEKKVGLSARTALLRFSFSDIQKWDELKRDEVQREIEGKRKLLAQFYGNEESWNRVTQQYLFGFVPIEYLP